MMKAIQGTVRGRTIELNEDLGMREGQDVTVTVTPLPPPRQWGDGIRRSAGVMANDAEFDAVTGEFHAGHLTPLVDSVFDISQGRQAFERLASGQQFGKIVVRIPD